MLEDTTIGRDPDTCILSQSPLQVSLVTSTGFTTLDQIATADNPKSTGSTGFQIAGQDLHPCIWFECDDTISTTELANQLDDLFNVYYRITYQVKGRRIVVIPTDRPLLPDELAAQAARVRTELKTLPNVLVCRPDAPLPARGATTSGVVGNYLLVPLTVEPPKPNGQGSRHANTSLEQAVQDDLAKRDLKVGDYGLCPITANEMHKLGFPAVAHCIGGIAIPYPSGKIGNVRLLGPNVSAKFKYCFPSGPRSEVYTLGQGALCIITEGEFKAMAIHKACLREGIEAKVIGLNGVWGWSGKSQGKVLAPYFEDALAGVTHVVTVFDYDGTDQVAAKFQGKPKYPVEMAEGQLCAALLATMTEVQFVRIALLTKVPRDKKYAIDDWLLIGTMRQVLGAATPFKVQWFDEAMLYALRRYGQWDGNILDLQARGQRLHTLQYTHALRVWGGPLLRPRRPKKPEEQLEDLPEDLPEDQPGKEGRLLNPIMFLNMDPRVVTVNAFDYTVEQPYGFVDDDGVFNLWRGWPKGVDGDVTPWTELVDRVLRHRPDEKAFFHNWVAWLIQNPGGKVHTYLALVSPENGVGKSLLAESVMAMFGTHGGELDGSSLFGQFNAQLQGKSLVVINELSSDKSAHVNAFKKLVSSAKLTVNEKFKPEFEAKSICNFILTSNSNPPLLVAKENRRDAIIKLAPTTAAERKQLEAICSDFVKWRDTGGIDIMRGFYSNYNITDFQPKGRAPQFKGFLDAVEASKSNNQQHVDEIDDFMDKCGLPVVFLSSELIMAITGCERKDSNQIQRLLIAHHKYIEKRPVIGPNRKTVRTVVLGEMPENPNYNKLYAATLQAVIDSTGSSF